MSDRFTPVPMGMGGGAAPTQTASRFTPVPAGMGGGQAPLSQGGGDSSDLGLGGIQSVLGAAKSGVGAIGGLDKAFDNPMGDYSDFLGPLGSGLGGVTSGLGLAQNIASGNPVGALQNAYGLYGAANSAFGLGGPTIGGAVSGGTEALTGAAAGTGGAAAGMLGLSLLPALYMIPGIASLLDTGGDRRPSIMHEIKTDAKNAPVVSQQAQTAANGMGMLHGATTETLRAIINNAVQSQAAGAQMSAAYDRSNTSAQGIKSPDYTGLQAKVNPLMNQGTLAALRATDALYNQGIDPSSLKGNIDKIPDFNEYLRYFAPQSGASGDPFNLNQVYNPQQYYRDASPSGEGAGYYFPTTDPKYASLISGAKPGQYESTLNQLFGLANPGVATSGWGKLQTANPSTGSRFTPVTS